MILLAKGSHVALYDMSTTLYSRIKLTQPWTIDTTSLEVARGKATSANK